MFITAVLLAPGLALLVYFFFRRSRNNYPPQPPGALPVVGHLFTLEDDLRPQYKKWHKELGEIFSLNIAGTLMVVLNGYDLIKDILVKRANEFSDRAPFLVDKALGVEQKGIVFSNGQNWKEQRKVTVSILRNFGMGKNILDQMIREEVVKFIALVSQLDGRPVDMKVNTNLFLFNIICTLLQGRRFEYDDDTLRDLMKKIHSLVLDTDDTQMVQNFPILGKLPGDMFHAKRLRANAKAVMDVIKEKFIKEIKMGSFNEGEPNSFVAAYLLERDRKLKDGQATTMNEENLARIVSDLFVAGSDTTSTALQWCLLYAVNFLDVQEKIFREIEHEIGLEKFPTTQDKSKLVYLNAYLAEASRLASVAAHDFTHFCPNETTIKGYKIPKNTIIVPNLDSIMYDKKIWGNDVMEFKPERFIDEDGKLRIPEQLIPFGIGRRACLGEGLAHTAMFLIMASLFQRFQLLPKDPKSPPPLKYIFAPDVSPVPFEIRFIDRREN